MTDSNKIKTINDIDCNNIMESIKTNNIDIISFTNLMNNYEKECKIHLYETSLKYFTENNHIIIYYYLAIEYIDKNNDKAIDFLKKSLSYNSNFTQAEELLNKLIYYKNISVDTYKLCFIISHRYYRNYPSFIELYIQNIKKYYTNHLILIVDNNSKYFLDIKEKLNNYDNIIYLVNESECKFEIGAYKYGINYLINNNLIDNYDYYICSQDNFVLINKYDFNILINNNVLACPINGYYADGGIYPIFEEVLKSINLYDNLDKLDFCWCNSLVLHKSKLVQFNNYVKNIVITIRLQSEASERYLSRILYELNNHKHFNIDGDIRKLKYDCWKVDLYNPLCDHFFIKRVQQKTERTLDD